MIGLSEPDEPGGFARRDAKLIFRVNPEIIEKMINKNEKGVK
jgi:hypothetical protein